MKARTASRLAWGFLVLGLPLLALAVVLSLGADRSAVQTAGDVAFFVSFIGMGFVGTLIVSRQPGNAVGWIFVATYFAAALAFFADQYARAVLIRNAGSLPGAVWAVWIADWAWVMILALPLTFLLLLFPDGKLPSRRWRPFAWITGLFLTVALLAFAFQPIVYRPFGVANPVGIEALAGLGRFVEGPGFIGLISVAIGSAVSLVIRFRRSASVERQQIKWFAFAGGLAVMVLVVSGILDTLGIRGNLFVNVLFPVAGYLSLPVGAGIAMLRHRLYDIDVVLNRTVVFGILAVFITAVYLGLVVGIGAVIGSRGNVLLSIAATALIALAFQPARERARRFANRLVYGKRATPYEVMSEFAERAAGTYSVDDVLPRMAEIVASGTGATRAAIWLRVDDELRRAASFPPEGAGWTSAVAIRGDDLPVVPGADACIPVRHREETLGAIAVAMPPAEPLTQTHEKLLSDVASQAGLVLRNARLIEDLRASRQRLVAAQDEERRRLERNIHDGAQQQLVALAVKLRLVESIARKDADKAADLAAQAKVEVQDALDNLRDLARGIYPPLLADQGLAAALEAQARKAAVAVEVHPDGVGRYPQEVEAGAYFCVLEALQNIAKYAEASRVDVSLRGENGSLVFEVRDDGRGFDPAATPHGSGLTNMRDRLEALGGSVEIRSAIGEGTTVRGRIPVGAG